jgi:hypothetical protein
MLTCTHAHVYICTCTRAHAHMHARAHECSGSCRYRKAFEMRVLWHVHAHRDVHRHAHAYAYPINVRLCTSPTCASSTYARHYASARGCTAVCAHFHAYIHFYMCMHSLVSTSDMRFAYAGTVACEYAKHSAYAYASAYAHGAAYPCCTRTRPAHPQRYSHI